MEENIEERVELREMATVCSKKDGYDIIIEVYSDDHGTLGDRTSPAYAHLKSTDGNYLGKFAITIQPPRAERYVYDCDKNHYISSEYKDKIVEWVKYKYRGEEISNWSALKLSWNILHP